MWQQIKNNQIRSAVLVAGMGILLLLVGYFLGVAFSGSGTGGVIIAFLLWGVLLLVAYFQGDSILLSVAGAKQISREDHPRLYNIVEEMKIASGLTKMPEIYIIDDPAPNAFATGRDQEHAAVAITSGLLQKLNRDELQGVVAHEIGHIKNRDVLLMVIAGVMLGTIVILAWYAQRMLFFAGGTRTRRDSKGSGGGGQIIILAVALVLMILAPVAAQLLYFAVSRKREYLADASGALYTRYPEGLASALEKIAASTTPVKSANQATAPMYIVNPFKKSSMSMNDLTSTHPPIADRIRILRAMGGASYADYEIAYRKAHGGKGIVSSVDAKAIGSVPIVTPSAADLTPLEKARETSGLLWQLNKYRTIDCACGTKLRVPPDYNQPAVRCPHCGRVHRLGDEAT